MIDQKWRFENRGGNDREAFKNGKLGNFAGELDEPAGGLGVLVAGTELMGDGGWWGHGRGLSLGSTRK